MMNNNQQCTELQNQVLFTVDVETFWQLCELLDAPAKNNACHPTHGVDTTLVKNGWRRRRRRGQVSLASTGNNVVIGSSNDLGSSYIRNQSGEIITINPINPQNNWVLGSPPQSRNANGLNQYLAINSNTITHDANGNLQSDGLWAYGHDLDNRLVSAVRSNPASGVSLGYDPAGRLSRTVIDN